ncbi:SUN domain-containing protein 2-like [Gambusia affinis]|uniref:SUN domain-containing protein 2-like n=1 Tax=Gambusia affinis TaxID=33528 RepID=UPI001CDCC8DB|nr:SUN domain-containing protein 2-like [Gambusia affinis]
MLRRSERLIENGYYDMYGQPTISYRETPIRRRRQRRPPVNRPANWEEPFRERFHSREEQDITDQENQMIDSLIQDCYNVFHFVFGLSVAFACIIYLFIWIISLHSRHSELSVKPTLTDVVTISGSKYQGPLSRLQLLETKLEHLLPQADLWPNFALESEGAMILHKTTSETYQSHKVCRLLGASLRVPPRGPNIVIKGRNRLNPGECWAFADFPGRLSIALTHKATVTHVSLGHIPKIVSPTSSISSAPKEFSVYGKKNLEDEETYLGTFLYDEAGDRIQTFKLPADKVGSFSFIKLQVNTNWGNPDYTCLYNFRVHGEPAV